MPAPVTAPTASGAEAVCPENRVKALDVLTWPRVGVRSPESPDRRWENRPRYDGKAVGTVLARYYDPATGQFLTVDPDVATTLSPYGYVDGNPLNGTDPSGDCGGLFGFVCTAWDATAGKAVNYVQTANLCLRAPWGGNNNNGGCHTTLSTSQGVQLVAATVVTAVGTVATLGLGDVVFAGIAGDLASGTLLGSVYAGIGAVGAWSVLGLPVAVAGIGLWWGYSALAARSGGCGG